MQTDPAPSDRSLRWFGVLLAGFVAALGLVATRVWGLPGAVGVWIWGAGGALCVVFWLVPSFRRPLWVGWMTAVHPIGWTVSHALLAAIWLLVLTPVGLVLRATGRDPLRRAARAGGTTFWRERDPPAGTDRYFRQF